ncbi:MAG: hypothetical protein AB8B55_09895 [Mariniblastus sp.]
MNKKSLCFQAKIIFLGVGLFLLNATTGAACGQDRSKQISEAGTKAVLKTPRILDHPDLSKDAIEAPIKKRIAALPIFAAEVPHSKVLPKKPIVSDASKRFVEFKLESKLVQSAKVETLENDLKRVQEARAEKLDTGNPKVEPGKVNWHKDFESACLASQASGKPVLHFQLLGQLDQRFT